MKGNITAKAQKTQRKPKIAEENKERYRLRRLRRMNKEPDYILTKAIICDFYKKRRSEATPLI